MIECIFGWGKQHGTMRKTKHRGIGRVAANFLLNLIAYNLIRIPNSLQRSSAAGKAAAQPNKKLPQASEHSDPNLIDSATETKNSNFRFQQTARSAYRAEAV